MTDVVAEAPQSVGRGVTVVRGILIALGVALIGFGGYTLVMLQPRPNQLIGVALWLIGAIVLHDAILSPLLVGVGLLMRRAGHRVPWTVIALVQGAIVIGCLFTLMFLPEIAVQQRGPKNATVVPLDYAQNLVIMWVVLAVIVVVGSIVLVRRTRSGGRSHSNVRPPSA
jgi:hypothetical protein